MASVLEVVPAGAVGAEVRGVDLAAVTSAQIEAIKAAWYRHDVLVFRKQKLTDDDLLAFSRHFGVLDPPPNQGAGRKSPAGHSATPHEIQELHPVAVADSIFLDTVRPAPRVLLRRFAGRLQPGAMPRLR